MIESNLSKITRRVTAIKSLRFALFEYKTVLNIVSDRYVVGIVQMATIYMQIKHFNCR